MKNTDIFDVLVVYTSTIAISPSSRKYQTPFGDSVDYNNAYSYFLEYCKSKNLRVALMTSDDIIGSGTGKAYWMWKNNRWHKYTRSCYSKTIFNKFFPKNKQQNSLYVKMYSDKTIQVLPKQSLVSLFTDKQYTANRLPQYSIPTVSIADMSLDSIQQSINELQRKISNHYSSNDLSASIILKDRFGLGGNTIYKIDQPLSTTIQSLMKLHPTTRFIIQPLLVCDKGYSSTIYSGYADIRLIFYGSTLIQAYVRTAKEGDFRCNMAQGGLCFYVNWKDLDPKLRVLAKKITTEVNYPHSLYALDFLISNSGNIYFVEGNSSPGLYWTAGIQQEETETKKLIHILVDELFDRVSARKHIERITPISSLLHPVLNPKIVFKHTKSPIVKH